MEWTPLWIENGDRRPMGRVTRNNFTSCLQIAILVHLRALIVFVVGHFTVLQSQHPRSFFIKILPNWTLIAMNRA